MKRKRFDLRNWRRVNRCSQAVYPMPAGVIVDFVGHEVSDPLEVVCCGQTFSVMQNGYRWIRYEPRDQFHALTVMLNEQDELQQIYVDITGGSGVDPDGIPWTDDLYLDVIALADANWQVIASEIIDQDELDEALAVGAITSAQYDHAWAEARAVQMVLDQQAFAPLEVLKEFMTTHTC